MDFFKGEGAFGRISDFFHNTIMMPFFDYVVKENIEKGEIILCLT
jgi:hypothetical protein